MAEVKFGIPPELDGLSNADCATVASLALEYAARPAATGQAIGRCIFAPYAIGRRLRTVNKAESADAEADRRVLQTARDILATGIMHRLPDAATPGLRDDPDYSRTHAAWSAEPSSQPRRDAMRAAELLYYARQCERLTPPRTVVTDAPAADIIALPVAEPAPAQVPQAPTAA